MKTKIKGRQMSKKIQLIKGQKMTYKSLTNINYGNNSNCNSNNSELVFNTILNNSLKIKKSIDNNTIKHK